MIRKLSLALAVAAVLNPLNASALGMGEIEVKSALNQVLNADIRLHSVDEGDLPGVRVKLASPAVFSKAGIERPYSLTQLKFKAQQGTDGSPVIKVSSTKPIREPFLNFLIEVDWSNGKLVREYTLLLDPPTTLKRRPPRVEPARIKAPPAPVKRRAPRAAPKPAPAPSRKYSASYSSVAAKEVRVRRNDTLWDIARRNQSGGASMQEMMTAIYRANPDAFYQNDMDSLKSGAILRIPNSEQIQKISGAEARNEYISGVSAWESTDYSGSMPMVDAPAPKARIETGKPSKPEQVAGEHLEILSAKPDKKGAAGDQASKSNKAQVDRLLKDLLLAKEATESARMENTELQDRVSSLQSQVSDLQRLISLKNDQMAKLQQRANDAAEKKRQAEEQAKAATESAKKAEQQAVTLAKQQQEKDRELQQLQAEKEQQIKALEQEKTAEQERLAKAQAEKEKQIKVLQAEKERQLKALQQAKAAEKEKLAKARAEKEAQIKALQAEKEAEKVRLAKEQAEKEARIKALQAEKEAAEALAKLERQKQAKAETVSKPVETKKPQPAVSKAPVAKPVEKPAPAVAKPQAKPQPKPAPVKKVEPIEEPGLLDDLLANPLMLAGGGGGALLLVLLLWLRNRNQQQEYLDEGIPDIPVSELTDDDSIPAFEDSEPLGLRGSGTKEDESDSSSSFLTDFTPSELEQLGDETADVDPSSEADVYIAYGRYQQAQELMKEAVEREPGRADLKVKFLEVLHASNAKSAFVEAARDFKNAGMDQKDPSGWGKILRMGRELAPDNELFGDGDGRSTASVTSPETLSASPATPATEETIDEDDYSELSLTKLAQEIEGVSPAGDDGKDAESILSDLEMESAAEVGGEDDFDLQLDELESLEKEDVGALGDITDELSQLGVPPAQASGDMGAEQKKAESTKEESSLDFDLDALDFTDMDKGSETDIDDLFDTMPKDTSEEEIDIQLGSINLDAEASEMMPESGLPNVDLEPGSGIASPSSIEPGAAIEPKGFDLETEALDLPTEQLDLDHLDGLSDLHTQPVDSDSFGLEGMSELPPTEQVDEVQTKLELAQAYQEMGDAEGARGILEEVVQEGNDDQKAEAKRLLSEL